MIIYSSFCFLGDNNWTQWNYLLKCFFFWLSETKYVIKEPFWCVDAIDLVSVKTLLMSKNYSWRNFSIGAFVRLTVSRHWSLSKPPENIKILLFFLYFQGVYKETSGWNALIAAFYSNVNKAQWLDLNFHSSCVKTIETAYLPYFYPTKWCIKPGEKN